MTEAAPEGDVLIALRVDVAEMRGMLKQALSDHGQRLVDLENDNRLIHGRLSDKGKTLATHTQQINGLEKAVNALEQNRIGGFARVGIVLGACTGIGGLLLAVFNALRI
jgi:hypothetical protein